jgi:nucleoside-diphosphate-sugar epimerase
VEIPRTGRIGQPLSAMTNPLARDLDHILEHTPDVWRELAGKRIFVTGGTGFFGCGLLESFAWACDRHHLGATMTVLTRSPEAFRTKAPHLATHRAIQFIPGDVRSFEYPTGSFDHVIHGATAASAVLNEADPLAMLDVIVQGTRRVLDFSVACGAGKLLFTSSGAIYGKQPPALLRLPESYTGTPDPMDPRSAYAEGKRFAELLCATYAAKHGLETKIARCFAFTGAYLPLDAHFAAGNFVRDKLLGGPIRVKGDGTALRSYLYAADLAVWLWTMLCKAPSCRPYNVGSDEGISISELAGTVANLNPQTEVQISARPVPGASAERYVPDTTRAREELKLSQIISLQDGLRRTAEWASGRSQRA